MEYINVITLQRVPNVTLDSIEHWLSIELLFPYVHYSNDNILLNKFNLNFENIEEGIKWNT